MVAIWNGSAASVALRLNAAAGLNAAAEELLAMAQPLTPELTEQLEKSASVYRTNPGELASQVQFKKFTAVWQHEKLNYQHPRGGQAKFLEAPLVQNAEQLAQIVVASIRQGF